MGLNIDRCITVLKNVYPPVVGKISRDFRLLSWKSPGLQVTQVGRSANMIAIIICSLIKKIGLQDKQVWGAYKILKYTHSCGDNGNLVQ